MSENIKTIVNAVATVGGSSKLTPVVFFVMSGSHTFGASAIVCWDELVKVEAAADFGAESLVGQNAYTQIAAALRITGSVELSQNMTFAEAMRALFGASSQVSTNFNVEPIHMMAVFDAFTKTASFDTETINVNVNIPVGGVLLIDGDTLTVLLNGANVIDKHSGAWPELTRSVYEMRFSSNNSIALEAQLVFTEQYL